MSGTRERNEHGQYTDRIPAEAALEAFDRREDLARPLTADDVMATLECSRRTAHNKLNELVDQGLLETRKVGARGRVWWVPMKGPSPPSGSRQVPQVVQQAVGEVDLPGSGPDLKARRKALLAAYTYLVEHPSAQKSDFLENVYPEHPANFETEEGWWNALQPALKELPGVDPPEERGNIWNYLGGDRFTPTLG